MFTREHTRQVRVGNVAIGGRAAVSVQTMTNTPTRDAEATIAQIARLASAGADIVRVALPTPADTAALPAIIAAAPVPIVADVHFHFQRALEAISAGAHKIRLNPGNISDRKHVLRVIDAARERGIPIRVGVNEGSVETKKNPAKRQAAGGRGLVQRMVRRLADYIRMFEKAKFDDVVLAAKSHDARNVIDVYTEIAKRWDYPLHLGVTHAGPPQTGTIRSAVALGALLANGIGNTIRVSFAAEPQAEVQAGKEILYALNLRRRAEPELIACPTCGRVQVDLLKLVEQVRPRLAELHGPIRVAVMGCVVNGPGEAAGADVAVCAGAGCGVIYRAGKRVAKVPESQIVQALLDQCRNWLAEDS